MKKKKSSIRCLLDYAGGYRYLTILGCVLSAIAAIVGLGPFICIWLVMREILDAWPLAVPIQAVQGYGRMAVVLAIAAVASYFVGLMCTHRAAFRTARNMRMQTMQHILDLPLGYFTQQQSGRLLKIIDDNANLTESLLAHQLPDLTGAIVTPIAAIGLLLIFDWRMGLITLLPMVVAFALLGTMMGGKNAGFFSRYQQALEKMSGEAVEYVRGIPVVKVFQQTVYSFKSFYAAIMSYKDLASAYALSCQKPMVTFTTVLNGTFLLLIPAGLLLLGRSGEPVAVLADWLFYILFAPACAMMMTRIMYASESVMQADEACAKLEEILAVKPLPESVKAQKPKKSDIVFENVSFTYPGGKRKALDNVSFTIKQGTKTALVGPSGGGKSTAAVLIPRFWDVSSGRITIGGVDVRDIETKELMKQVAFVFQDTKLFKASLLENIRAARPSASREEVLEAIRQAHGEDILAKLPQGLDTIIGAEGIYLSGGEGQRIALARAIIQDAPIVVLDEATAFADPEKEWQIQQTFAHLLRGKTVLMIAHRLSSVQDAEQILVLDEGQIVGQGRHDELLAMDGLYSKMWRDYKQAASWKIGKEAKGYEA